MTEPATFESRVREAARTRYAASPCGYSPEQIESIIAYTLEHATGELTTEWRNISNNVNTGSHKLFGAAENLVYLGLAERENRPAKIEHRWDYGLEKRVPIELGCRCYFRLLPEEGPAL